jgi:arylsulfatase A-like enzyme
MTRRWLPGATQVVVVALLLGIPAGVLLGAARSLPYLETDDVLVPLFADAMGQCVVCALLALALWNWLRGVVGDVPSSLLAFGPLALLLALELRECTPRASGPLGGAVLFALLALLVLALHAGLSRWWRDAQGAARLAPLLSLALVPVVLQGLSGRRDPGPDVVVILIDILGADRLGCYGYQRPTSPHIDRFAREAVLFENAISSATFTKTSVASLFTALYPFRHGVYEGTLRKGEVFESDVLARSDRTLAEDLSALGLHTVAWVENGQLRGYMGFDQGFDLYRDQPGDAETIGSEFSAWRRAWAGRTRYFAYLHLLDLHGPYDPGPSFQGRFGPETEATQGLDHESWRVFKRDVNDGELQLTDADLEALSARHDEKLLEVDAQVGRILDDLRASGRWDDTLVVITSDHGEAFGEHGFIAHSKPPYDELVRVPLLVKLPGSRAGGRRVSDMVGLVDVAPTLVELLGGEPRRDVDGRSFAAALEADGDALEPRTHFMEHHAFVGVRTERWKYIRRGGRSSELYDLSADPGEQEECSAQYPDVAARFRAACEGALEQRALRTQGERVDVDPETLEQLKGLGYL